MAWVDFLPGQVNSPSTTLTGDINDVVDVIPVAELGVFPTPGATGSLAVIGTGSTAETIHYTGKSAATGAGNLTGCSRGYDSDGTYGVAASWISGETIARNFCAHDFETICGNIEDHSSRHKSGGDDAIKLDDLATPDDNTDLDATTTEHGLLLKATAPDAGIRNVIAIDNGETTYKNTALLDITNPELLGTIGPGSSLIAARRDHVHANYTAAGVGLGIGKGSAPSYLLEIKGTASTDLPTYSDEFLDADNWTSTNWTGSFAAGWRHPVGTIETATLNTGGSGYVALEELTVVQAGGSGGTIRVDTVDGSGVILTFTVLAKGEGYAVATGLDCTGGSGAGAKINITVINNTTVLSHDHAAVNATKYQIAYTVTGRTAGTFTIIFGGQTSDAISATGAWGPVTTGTGVLQITPTATFNGTIVISIKSVTAASTPIHVFTNSSGTPVLEMRGHTLDSNTFIGLNAGRSNSTGYNNTFIGLSAGNTNSTGYNNTFIGLSAGNTNSTGYNNTFIGLSAGYTNSTGYFNTFIGRYAGYTNSTGYNNTFIGLSAGNTNSTGYNNTFIGLNAGYTNSTGYNNTFIGRDAGRSNSTGYNNTFIGLNAGYNTNQLATAINSMGLGANTFTNRNNQVVIGDASVVETHLRTGVYIGSTSTTAHTQPTARLHIAAGAAGAGLAPIKLTAGTNLTTPENGAFEFDGTNLYFTAGGTRRTISWT